MRHSSSCCCAVRLAPRTTRKQELERIQREHLAYHARLRESGQVVTNGPVDGPDPSLRGLTFYRTGSRRAVRQLAEADPAVAPGGWPWRS